MVHDVEGVSKSVTQGTVLTVLDVVVVGTVLAHPVAHLVAVAVRDVLKRALSSSVLEVAGDA